MVNAMQSELDRALAKLPIKKAPKIGADYYQAENGEVFSVYVLRAAFVVCFRRPAKHYDIASAVEAINRQINKPVSH